MPAVSLMMAEEALGDHTRATTTAQYAAECSAAGVPNPPPFSVRSPDWTKVDPPVESALGGTAELWMHESGHPSGLCVAFPRPGTSEATIEDLGIICHGAVTNTACFWDAKAVPSDGVIDTRSMLAGDRLTSDCTRCHAGQDPFIVLDTTRAPWTAMPPMPRSPGWYVPLIRPRFGQNRGPMQDVPQAASACAGCHSLSGEGGAFPIVSTEIRAWCSNVLVKASGLMPPPAGPMPPGAYPALVRNCSRSVESVLPPPGYRSHKPGRESTSIFHGNRDLWWITIPETQQSFAVGAETPVVLRLDVRTLFPGTPHCMGVEIEAIIDDDPYRALTVYDDRDGCGGGGGRIFRTFAKSFSRGAHSIRFRARARHNNGPPSAIRVRREHLQIETAGLFGPVDALPISRSFDRAIQSVDPHTEDWIPLSVSGTAFELQQPTDVHLRFRFRTLFLGSPYCVGFEVEAIFDGDEMNPHTVYDDSQGCGIGGMRYERRIQASLPEGIHVVELRGRARLNGGPGGLTFPVEVESLSIWDEEGGEDPSASAGND